jgi:hypothetical protein
MSFESASALIAGSGITYIDQGIQQALKYGSSTVAMTQKSVTDHYPHVAATVSCSDAARKFTRKISRRFYLHHQFTISSGVTLSSRTCRQITTQGFVHSHVPHLDPAVVHLWPGHVHIDICRFYRSCANSWQHYN